MLLWGSSASYWVKSFWGLQSPLVLQLPSAGKFCLPPSEQVGPAGLFAQGLGGSCSEPMLQVWSPPGSQAVNGVAQRSQALGLCPGAAQLLIYVGTHSRFQVLAPRPLIEVHAHPGTLCLCAQAARLLIRAHAHPGFQVWAPGH